MIPEVLNCLLVLLLLTRVSKEFRIISKSISVKFFTQLPTVIFVKRVKTRFLTGFDGIAIDALGTALCPELG